MPPHQHLKRRLVATAHKPLQKFPVREPPRLTQSAGLPQSVDQLMKDVGLAALKVAFTIRESFYFSPMRNFSSIN
jgi:hypothetical protein